jgi:hypothetical protein
MISCRLQVQNRVGVGLESFQIRPDFRSYIAGRFWRSRIPNYGKPISDIFVAFYISFPTPLISPQSDTWAKSYG